MESGVVFLVQSLQNNTWGLGLVGFFIVLSASHAPQVTSCSLLLPPFAFTSATDRVSDEALTVTCLFLSGECAVLVVPKKTHWSVASCSKALLTLCFGTLVLSELPVLQIRGLAWGGAQRRDEGCHCCCCCAWRQQCTDANKDAGPHWPSNEMSPQTSCRMLAATLLI